MGISCAGSKNPLSHSAIGMYLTAAWTTFYQNPTKALYFCIIWQWDQDCLPPQFFIWETFWFWDLVTDFHEQKPGLCESAALISKFLNISTHSPVDLCPSSYDTKVANAVIPVELIPN